jgi:hypothetical protein
MNETPKPEPASLNPTPWLFGFAFIGVLVAVVFGRPLLELFREAPKPTSPEIYYPEPQIKIPPKPEDVAKPHLSRAEKEAERVIEEHVKSIDTFFADSKKNTRAFAGEALSWRSKWRLAADYVPFTSGDRNKKFIRQKFEDHIFTPAQLEDAVKQVVKSYIAQMRSIESKMLVDLRADVSDFPATYPLAQLDDKRLQESYDKALSRAIEATGGALQGDIATQLVSIIAGEVLTQVAVRLGVSAGILGAGAASGWATLGIGVIVGLIVDQIVSWVWDWWADPRGNLAAELDKKLDEVNGLIVDGSSDVQGLRARLQQFSRERAATRRTAVLSLLQPTGGVTK